MPRWRRGREMASILAVGLQLLVSELREKQWMYCSLVIVAHRSGSPLAAIPRNPRTLRSRASWGWARVFCMFVVERGEGRMRRAWRYWWVATVGGRWTAAAEGSGVWRVESLERTFHVRSAARIGARHDVCTAKWRKECRPRKTRCSRRRRCSGQRRMEMVES